MNTSCFSRRAILLAAGLLLAATGLLAGGCDMLGGESSDDDEYSIGCPPICEDPIFRSVDRFPAWSPDSTRIAYYHISQEEGERSGIWILNLKTGKQEFLVRGRHSTWGPEGDQLAFTRDRDIYRIDLSSRAVHQLTECGSCGAPDWSPDGQRIAFTSGERLTGSEDSLGTWLMNSDGSELEYVGVGTRPTWAPSSEHLGMVITREGGHEIGTYDLRQSSLKLLTGSSEFVSPDEIDWSPTGSKIAWYSSHTGSKSDWGIWVVGIDGTNARRLVPNGHYPSWSPDGSKLVFQYVYSGDHPALREGQDVSTLAVADADGSNIRPLTRLSDYLPK